MNTDTPICKDFTENDAKYLLFVQSTNLEVYELQDNTMKLIRSRTLSQKIVLSDVILTDNGSCIIVVDSTLEWFVFNTALQTLRNGILKKPSQGKQSYICCTSWNESSTSLLLCSILREHLTCFTIYWTKKNRNLQVKVENFKISSEIHWNTVNSNVKCISVIKGNCSFDFAVFHN